MSTKRPASSNFKPSKPVSSKTMSKTGSESRKPPNTMLAKKISTTGQRQKKSRVLSPESSENDETASEDEDSIVASEAIEGTSSSASEDGMESNSTPQQVRRSNGKPRIPNQTSKTTARHISPHEEPEMAGPPVVPEKLLTSLLHSHFQQPDTKIGRDARGLVGKYVETFILEAVARAVVERKGGAGTMKNAGSGSDFLEVCESEI